MNRRLTLKTACGTTLFCLGLMIGCEGGSGRIEGAELALPMDENSPSYLDRVSSMEAVPENDALRGLLMLIDGKDDCENFRQRVEKLRARRIIPPSWNCQADRPITKGRLAYMLYQACGIRGGATLTLAGPSRRYCLKELQYQGFMSSGMTNTEVTGLEFVAALTRCDTFLQTGELPELISSTGE